MRRSASRASREAEVKVERRVALPPEREEGEDRRRRHGSRDCR
jgi:hypothetical protein